MSKMTPKLRSIFGQGYDLIRSGELKTLIPYLCLFRLNGQPMNLRLHYQLAPMYATVQPAHSLYMLARQLGKSYSACSSMALRNMLIPYYHTVIVQPRADQIQRLISTVYKPLLNSCPIIGEFIDSNERTKLALREFRNGSMCYAEHMFESADRIRGISGAASLHADECQDIEYEFLDIAAEVMSASMFWGFSIYSGTPKTTDTTLGLLWERSSQAEWVIKCTHCNNYNVPNPENDLEKMIGKHGAICAKCGRDITPANGGYVHSYPERMHSFPGYHISQTVHPLHLINQHKWNQLLEKVKNYDQQTLYNEVFGWPYDAAVSPLTMKDMQKATFTPKDEQGKEVDIQKPEDVRRVAWQYSYITVGVDWSGGGMVSDSYTAYAVVGLRKDAGVVDVLYGKRIPKGLTPTEEANEILDWLHGTQANAFAYDNHGAGFTRLEIMKHQGLHDKRAFPNLECIAPMDYVRPHSGDVMQRRDAIREPDMYYFNIDKSRSLAVCIMSIKANRLRFKPFKPEDEKAYQRDFLALREDPRVSLGNETVILIIKKPGVPDDFAHAVNFACSQMWDHFGAYPAIGSRYDASVLDFDENHHQIMPDEQFGPRSDWDRFSNAVSMRSYIVESDMPY